MKAALLLFIVGIASLMQSCDLLNPDMTSTPLVADYSVVTDYEGYSCLHFQKHMWSKDVPLIQIDSAAVVSRFLATCMSEGGRYYLLPLHPNSKEIIDKNSIGPLNRSAYRLKLNELVGDSTLRLSHVQ